MQTLLSFKLGQFTAISLGRNKAEMVEAVKIVSCLMNEVDAGAEKLIGKGEASVQQGMSLFVFSMCL